MVPLKLLSRELKLFGELSPNHSSRYMRHTKVIYHCHEHDMKHKLFLRCDCPVANSSVLPIMEPFFLLFAAVDSICFFIDQ